jgi:hypothetical protein
MNKTFPVRLPTGQQVTVEVVGANDEQHARQLAAKAVAGVCGHAFVDERILDQGQGARAEGLVPDPSSLSPSLEAEDVSAILRAKKKGAKPESAS